MIECYQLTKLIIIIIDIIYCIDIIILKFIYCLKQNWKRKHQLNDVNFKKLFNLLIINNKLFVINLFNYVYAYEFRF